MLDHGSSANAQDALGNTPLMLAGIYGDLPCVRLLVERGADVGATNMAGATPFWTMALGMCVAARSRSSPR